MVTTPQYEQCTRNKTNTCYRDFISLYWPSPNTPGHSLRDMYERIAISLAKEAEERAAKEAAAKEAAAKAASPDAGAAKVNGETNGVAVKQE